MNVDTFAKAIQNKKKTPATAKHAERAHSKFSASGAERWFNCPGSVELSEGIPDKDNEWSLAGTQAHELLEAYLKCELSGNDGADVEQAAILARKTPHQMVATVAQVSDDVVKRWEKKPGSKLFVERRVYLKHIHPDMFGTLDISLLEFFGYLEVFDYKNGQTFVSPKENLQMIFYALALAHEFDWNFSRAKLAIIQPNIRGYDGPSFWDIPISNLRMYEGEFKRAVDRVEKFPELYREGDHCHWCKAKKICPLKTDRKNTTAKNIFKGV